MKNQIFTLTLVMICLNPSALRARYLDTDNGRFTTMDTFAGNNEDPLSLHKYLYAEDEPVNGCDPTGLTLYDCDIDVVNMIEWPFGGQHEYLWDTINRNVSEMTGSRYQNWSDPFFEIGAWRVWGQVKQGSEPPYNAPNVRSAEVVDSAGRELWVEDYIRHYRAHYFSGVQDCHTMIKNALEAFGLVDPNVSGRINYREAADRLTLLSQVFTFAGIGAFITTDW